MIVQVDQSSRSFEVEYGEGSWWYVANALEKVDETVLGLSPAEFAALLQTVMELLDELLDQLLTGVWYCGGRWQDVKRSALSVLASECSTEDRRSFVHKLGEMLNQAAQPDVQEQALAAMGHFTVEERLPYMQVIEKMLHNTRPDVRKLALQAMDPVLRGAASLSQRVPYVRAACKMLQEDDDWDVRLTLMRLMKGWSASEREPYIAAIVGLLSSKTNDSSWGAEDSLTTTELGFRALEFLTDVCTNEERSNAPGR